MIARIIIVTLALIPAAAQSSTWYAPSPTSNACDNMAQFSQEVAQFGAPPIVSPQDYMDWLRIRGASPTENVMLLPNGDDFAAITYDTPTRRAGQIFYTDLADCQKSVSDLINGGFAGPPPGAWVPVLRELR